MVQVLEKVLFLNVFGALCFLLFAWVGTGTEGHFSSYVAEVARHSIRKQDLLIYIVYLLLYAVGIEFILRSIQSRVSEQRGSYVGIVVVAILYAVLHQRHGTWASAYALCLGLICATAYHRWRNWPTLAVWHVQWDLGTLAVYFVLAMYNVSPFAPSISYYYKRSLMEKGRILYHDKIGWIDAAHYWSTYKRVCYLTENNRYAEDTVVIPVHYRDLWGFEHAVSMTVQHPKNTEHPPHEQIKEIVWLAAIEEEKMQAAAPIWSGLRLSAWNSEDLRSTRAALDGISPSFFNDCQTWLGVMPSDFQPEQTQQQQYDKWPTREAYLMSGLP